MEKKENTNISSPIKKHPTLEEYQELLETLQHRKTLDGGFLVNYKGHWLYERFLRNEILAREGFKARTTDVITASLPKSGTTWLKALIYSIVNRRVYSADQTPLLTTNPHDLVPFIELDFDWDHENLDLDKMSSPRIFATHMGYKILPISILESDCKIIYICRNPFDNFVSLRQFFHELVYDRDAVPPTFDMAFDLFCQGIHPEGPFWEHMLGYWNAHQKNPQKVLFLKYEDLKEDIASNVRKIAEFIELPFSLEEDGNGLVDEIATLCSFDKLRSLEVNKTGTYNVAGTTAVKNSAFFRKGEIGDWTNFLTPPMARRLRKVAETKLEGSGLSLKMEN